MLSLKPRYVSKAGMAVRYTGLVWQPGILKALRFGMRIKCLCA